MKVKARDLIGRTITAVEFNVFGTGVGSGKTTAPVLTLDNGRRLYFNPTETEVGEYGIELGLTAKRKKAPKVAAQ